MIGDRRAFLCQLVRLPLVGGGVTLIGAPTASAEPVTERLLDTYEEWLREEHIQLVVERTLAGRDLRSDLIEGTPALYWHQPPRLRWLERTGRAPPAPSTRAALILSAVGCDWRKG